MSELACWYDNEEGDFRRSIYRGERPRESEKDRPGRWQETDGQIRFEEGREGNHETETEERTSRPMEEAFVSYVYAQRWLDQGTDTSIHCNTPPILRFNVSLSLTALSLPLSLHLSVSSFRGSRPQIDMRDRTEENERASPRHVCTRNWLEERKTLRGPRRPGRKSPVEPNCLTVCMRVHVFNDVVDAIRRRDGEEGRDERGRWKRLANGEDAEGISL